MACSGIDCLEAGAPGRHAHAGIGGLVGIYSTPRRISSNGYTYAAAPAFASAQCDAMRCERQAA